jgi:hypothetical protein
MAVWREQGNQPVGKAALAADPGGDDLCRHMQSFLVVDFVCIQL